MILLSATHRLNIKEIAQACDCSTNTVKSVFNSYESSGLEALLDKNMAYNENSLNIYSTQKILGCVGKSAQNLKQAVALLWEREGIQTSKGILGRYLKKKWSWHRVRQSLKSQRDDLMFDFFKAELVALKALEKQELIDLYFCDESTF